VCIRNLKHTNLMYPLTLHEPFKVMKIPVHLVLIVVHLMLIMSGKV